MFYVTGANLFRYEIHTDLTRVDEGIEYGMDVINVFADPSRVASVSTVKIYPFMTIVIEYHEKRKERFRTLLPNFLNENFRKLERVLDVSDVRLVRCFDERDEFYSYSNAIGDSILKSGTLLVFCIDNFLEESREEYATGPNQFKVNLETPLLYAMIAMPVRGYLQRIEKGLNHTLLAACLVKSDERFCYDLSAGHFTENIKVTDISPLNEKHFYIYNCIAYAFVIIHSVFEMKSFLSDTVDSGILFDHRFYARFIKDSHLLSFSMDEKGELEFPSTLESEKYPYCITTTRIPYDGNLFELQKQNLFVLTNRSMRYRNCTDVMKEIV